MLTSKNILDYIKYFIENHGYAPSTRDIAEEFSCSVSTVNRFLKSLRDDGYIEFEDGKNRTLHLTEATK